MKEVMTRGIRPDAVFGQNDRMAWGAREALGAPADVAFFGVDALPEAGLQEVIDGHLTASYLYLFENGRWLVCHPYGVQWKWKELSDVVNGNQN